MPRASRSRKALATTMPASTDTPESVMNPTAAEIDSGIPRKASAQMPPTQAKGTLTKSRTVSDTLR